MNTFMQNKSVVHTYFTLLVKRGVGGVMNLVYGSSSSSSMDCYVFFSDE